MAKRLSKALREKRRWIGVLVHPRHQHRDAVEQVLLQISQTIEPEPSLRLMDFFPQHERPALAEQPELARLHGDGGLAIVRAPLKAMVELRNLLQDNNALETLGIEFDHQWKNPTGPSTSWFTEAQAQTKVKKTIG